MNTDLKDTASLLGSRVCHDLISPLGAISNGLELLAMSGAPASPEMKLIEESIAAANARVRFFRVAFGGSSGSQILARSEILHLIDGVYGEGRIKVHWNPPSDPTRTEAKVAFIALQCLETTLPQGGKLIIDADRGIWTVQSFGENVKYDANLWSGLAGKAALEVSSAQVQFQLLKEALDTLGLAPQIGYSDSAVSLRY